MPKINKILIYFLLASFLYFPAITKAAMQSSSYVIYENVMHTFDGPVISAVTQSVTGTSVTITWNTSVVADAFVIYDTDNGFGSSQEQGSSVKSSTNHSVTLTGLDANTTYYYRVKSTRINGGVTTDLTARSFITGAGATPPTPPTPPAPSGGGGILIIDKTDKVAPTITDLSFTNVTADSVEVSWKTDEVSTSFVEYGAGSAFGSTYGQWATTTQHKVTVETLKPKTKYNFRALSSDAWGNVGRSGAQEFTTLVGEPGEKPATTTEIIKVTDDQAITAEATRRAFEFLSRLFPEVSLNRISPANLFGIGSIADLNNFIPAPILSGQPIIKVGATDVTISWTTDIKANSLIAIASADNFKANASEPYQQEVGNSEEQATEHEVKVYGLTPNTDYHFQLRSKSGIGPTARSRDFTFRTNLEELQIISFFSQIIDTQTAVFKWVTNKEADSTVTFSPYHENVVALDLSKTVKDNAQSVIHEVTIKEFQSGVVYEVELGSQDQEGNTATQALSHFTTGVDDASPEVSRIKADSTVFLDRGDKIQTIISWSTNEPSTSQVYFQEGVQGGDAKFTDNTTLNDNYTKEHVVVITKFKPGVVYSFRVESKDSNGNTTLSKVHTFMTAKKKESIIQVIIRILEETFGWTKKLM